LATSRPDPVPFYGELGSVNPVVVLPAAAELDGAGIADSYASSLTLGNGQFCTNPGLMFVPNQPDLLARIADAVASRVAGPLLTAGIRDSYVARTRALSEHPRLALLAAGMADGGTPSEQEVRPQVYVLPLDSFADDIEGLSEECFGPTGLVVTYSEPKDLPAALDALPGSLTASIHAAPADYEQAREVADVLQRRVGRLVFNGWPTGVAVCWAMHHGGPWPATTASAYTSVGARAIDRWLVPIAFQGWPDELLPQPLQAGNPLQIVRRTNDSVGR
jgi:NADP-dependent aldehyde dehydrogenase